MPRYKRNRNINVQSKLRFETLEPRSLLASLNIADLLVDSNRDGKITVADNLGEDTWVDGKSGRGAIILPNLDRDNKTTAAPDNWVGGNFNGLPVAPNNIIDNAADLQDIGKIRLAKLDPDSIYNYRLTIRVSRTQAESTWFANTKPEDRIRLFLPTKHLPNGDTTIQENDVAVIGPGLGHTIVFTSNVRNANEYPVQLLQGQGGFFLALKDQDGSARCNYRNAGIRTHWHRWDATAAHIGQSRHRAYQGRSLHCSK